MAGNLTIIKDKLAGKEKIVPGKGPVLDAKNSIVIVQRACLSGYRGHILTELIEQAQRAELKDLDAKAFYFAAQELNATLKERFAVTAAAWTAENAAKTAPVQFNTEVSDATFVAWARENYKGMPAGLVAIATAGVKAYFTKNGSLPKDGETLDAWMPTIQGVPEAVAA